MALESMARRERCALAIPPGNEDEIARDDDGKDRPLASTFQIRRKRLYPDRSALHMSYQDALVIGWTPIVRTV